MRLRLHRGGLTDFDCAASLLLAGPRQTVEKQLGASEFWKRLTHNPNLYDPIDLMRETTLLSEAARHVDPIIRTTAAPTMGCAPVAITAPCRELTCHALRPVANPALSQLFGTDLPVPG